jgi:hypothetical protein
MDDGQKTPRGHPDFYSYVKILRIFIWNGQTNGQTDGEIHLEELFFQLCCCVSFWFWREIGFGFTYLRTLLNRLSAKSVLAGEKLVATYSIPT